MSLARAAAALSIAALVFLAPSAALADHCGGGASVTPASGPPGTTFVFQAYLGTTSELSLYREGKLVRSMVLHEPERYSIETQAGDAGSWRARAVANGNPDCIAEATFIIVGTPDTSTRPDRPAGALPWLIAAGFAGLLVGLRRFAKARSLSDAPTPS